jgi:type II secretion system protein G
VNPAAPSRAFTLIELLVVVAVIAILAAIALPNFLEARTRAMVSRTLTDLRTLSTALESYRVDNNRYPPHGEVLATGVVNFPAVAAGINTVEFTPGFPLTTPVGYLATLPTDRLLHPGGPESLRLYGYIESDLMRAILLARGFTASANGIHPTYGGWRLYAAGPDGDKGPDTKVNLLYDPTNGTISDGDLVRTQREPLLKRAGDE